MARINQVMTVVKYSLLMSLACSVLAQQPAQQRAQGGQSQAQVTQGAVQGRNPPSRPPLFFREEWQQTWKQTDTGDHPLVPGAVANPNLELQFYGSRNILSTGVVGDENNPIRVWTGNCETPCGITLRDKDNYVDLTGLARINWVTRTSGFHKLRPMIKLADGTVLVGDHADGDSSDYEETEFSLARVHWIKLDPDKVVTKGDFLDKPDLSRVDEVGFVDLMPGSGHGLGGFCVLQRLEVYGRPVQRNITAQTGATQRH